MKRYSIEVIQNIFFTPLGVLFGVGGAIVFGVKVFWDPLKTAKIKASECDLKLYYTKNSLQDDAWSVAYEAWRRFRDEVQAATSRQELINKHFLNSPAVKQQLEDEIAKTPSSLVKVLFSCQVTRAFYQQAQQALKAFNGRDLVIRTVPHEKATFGACCCYSIGEIWISDKVNARTALGYLIFELANMTHASRFWVVTQQAINKQIDKKTYAYAMEEIEYDSMLLHTTTIKDAIAEQGAAWQDLDCYHHSALDENSHWRAARESGHTAFYEKWWEDNVR